MATIINPRKVADSKNSKIAFHGLSNFELVVIVTLWVARKHNEFKAKRNYILQIVLSPESNGGEASSAHGTATTSMLNTVAIVQMKVLKEIIQNGSNSDQY